MSIEIFHYNGQTKMSIEIELTTFKSKKLFQLVKHLRYKIKLMIHILILTIAES